MIACVFGLTACGSKGEEELTVFEKEKVQRAEQCATQKVIPTLVKYMDDDRVHVMDQYTPDEVVYLVADIFEFNTERYVFTNAISSFYNAKESIGNVVDMGEVTSKIDGEQIIVYVQIMGEKKNAEAELIFSNDMFTSLESAALNPISSMGELMGKAALNTVIGMGTVFAVLILISLIISCFGVIPKIQKAFADKKKKTGTAGIDNQAVQIAEQEENNDLSDDLELVAVIAAAVAASEGAASTDGFVVRSIRKAKR